MYMNKLNKVGKVAYETTAIYGRIRSILGTIFGTIFAIVFMIIGIRMFMDSRKYKNTVMADITSASCYKINAENSGYHCELNVTYSVNDKQYTVNLKPKDNKKYVIGNKLLIGYNINDPKDIIVPINQVFILLFFFGGLFMIISSWVHLYFVMKSKTYAAIEGSAGFYNNFIRRKNTIRKN